MQRGIVARICDVFVSDWCNLIFHIHDFADPRYVCQSEKFADGVRRDEALRSLREEEAWKPFGERSQPAPA